MIGIKTPKKNDKKFSLDGLNSNNNSGIFIDHRRLSFGPENFNINSKIKKDNITDITINIFDFEKKHLKSDNNFSESNNTKDLNINKSKIVIKKKFKSSLNNDKMIEEINLSKELKIKKINSVNYIEDKFAKKEFLKENNIFLLNKSENLKKKNFLEFSDLKEINMSENILKLNSSTISFKGFIDTNNKEELDVNFLKNEEVFEKQVNLDLKNKFNFFKKEDMYSKIGEFDIISLIIKNGGVKIESEEELHTPELYKSGFKKKKNLIVMVKF